MQASHIWKKNIWNVNILLYSICGSAVCLKKMSINKQTGKQILTLCWGGWKVKVKAAQLCLTLCEQNSPGQNSGVGSLSLLWGIFPTQGLNPSLLHCRQILYQLNHEEGPIMLEWVAYPFSRGSSWSRNRTRVSCIAGGFFTNWAIREAPG